MLTVAYRGLGGELRGRGDTFLVPYRDTPGADDGGYGSVSAPATWPRGRPQGPDPQPGSRLSIRPQPTRAPRDQVMALGPLRRREPVRAVARGPTTEWGGGGTAGGTAAAALQLPLALGVTGTAARVPPPPSPPPPEQKRPRG